MKKTVDRWKFITYNNINVYNIVYNNLCVYRENMEQVKISQAQKAYNNIRNDIIYKKYAPGYPLSEAELAENLQMSRTPVREALSRLREEGLIYTPRGKGLIIKNFSNDDIKQAYEYAECLESMAVFLLTQNKNNKKNEISLLEHFIELMEDANTSNNVTEWIEADDSFHETICNNCGNDFIKKSLIHTHGIVHYTRLIITKTRLNLKQSTSDHKNALNMMKKGNGRAAQTIMSEHWERIRNEVMHIIS